MLGENFAKYRNFKILSAFMCTKVLGENFAKYRNFKILSAFMCTKVLGENFAKYRNFTRQFSVYVPIYVPN